MVEEAAVVSMPHIRLGEGVCAYLVLRGTSIPTLKEISLFVSESGLAKHKCPERIEFIGDLPRTASGKIRKDLLRADIAERMVRPPGAVP